jgi:hypothetical protein
MRATTHAAGKHVRRERERGTVHTLFVIMMSDVGE